MAACINQLSNDMYVDSKQPQLMPFDPSNFLNQKSLPLHGYLLPCTHHPYMSVCGIDYP